MKLHRTKIGSTLYLHDESEHARKVIHSQIIPDGYAARFEDGSEEWIIDEPIVDLSKSGSDQYIWDKSGNRCKHNRVRYQKNSAGQVSSTIERTIYKEL
jgi:hypothetical protein